LPFAVARRHGPLQRARDYRRQAIGAPNHDFLPAVQSAPNSHVHGCLDASQAFERATAMKLYRRRLLHLAVAAVAGFSASSIARAQDYPTRPVTIIVPFTPGGSTDIVARLLAQKLEQRLGKSFVVENRPGAGTIIAASAVAKAEPDGYMLLMAPSSTMAINVTLYKKLPYDPATDFIPLAGLARVPFVLIVNPSLPVRSLPELIAYAKERPGQLSFASVGPGVPHHLYAELLMSTAGIAMMHVPYKGSAPALNDVVAGHIPLMFCDIPPAIGMLQAGKVRALGVTTRTRVLALPDVPPIAEAGLPEFGGRPGWHMMVAPMRTPRDIVEKLHAELIGILALPQIDTEINRLGMLAFENPSLEGLRDFIRSETVRWGKIVERAGIARSE
jgi:tripartite-type tricarboxylate transporter receptor subunit TctC